MHIETENLKPVAIEQFEGEYSKQKKEQPKIDKNEPTLLLKQSLKKEKFQAEEETPKKQQQTSVIEANQQKLEEIIK